MHQEDLTNLVKARLENRKGLTLSEKLIKILSKTKDSRPFGKKEPGRLRNTLAEN